MSDGVPFFNSVNFSNLANSNFEANMNFGFSLGNFDFSNLKLQNGVQGMKVNNPAFNSVGENKENDNNKKKKGPQKKFKNKKQQNDDAPSPNLEQNTDSNHLLNEDSNGVPQNNQLAKASKKIRKMTLAKLQKKAERFQGNYNGKPVANAFNKKSNMNKYAPGKCK